MLRRKVLSLATVLVSLITSGVAVAQEPTPPPPAAPPAADVVVGQVAPPTPAGEEVTEEILVTGTRIPRTDLTTPAPVTVIGREQITASGKVSIGDFLQALPEQGNALNTAVNNGGDGSTRVNLRGLGEERTLVLVNGRRFVPGSLGGEGFVDLNSIPTAAIERIEILKDGASAIYGSDAIAGVVNLITRKGFSGTEVSAFAGTTSRGDGNTYDVNISTGTSGERGGILFSAGYYTQSKIMAGDRDFSKIPLGFFAPGNLFDEPPGPYTLGSTTIPAGRIVLGSGVSTDEAGNVAPDTLPTGARGVSDPSASTLYNTLIETCPTANVPYTVITNPDGTTELGPAAGTRLACTNSYIVDPSESNGWRNFRGAGLDFEGGDGYNFQPENYLLTPQERIQLFAIGDRRFGDVARGYFEASYVNRQSGQDLAPEPFLTDIEGIVVSGDNIYNPFGREIGAVRRRLLEFGRRRDRQDRDTFRLVGGVDGSLPEVFGPAEGWFWDASLNYGRSQGTELKQGRLLRSRLEAAVGPSFIDPGPDGVLQSSPGGLLEGDDVGVCGTPEAPIEGCVPLDLFHGAGTIAPDQIAGLTYAGTRRSVNKLFAAQVNLSGELFELPTSERPLGVAVGYEHRRVSGRNVPDPITVLGDTTGNKETPTIGGYDVNEGYAELSVPVLSARPFAEELEVTVAARAFDYSTFGSDWTYKLGGRWRIIPDVTIRGTYSTAFRAPAVDELFQGLVDDFPSLSDPCADTTGNPQLATVCGAASNNGDEQTQLRSQIGGNPDLQPETADIYTVGVVIEPRWVRNLSLTVDYFNVEVRDSITDIGAAVILEGCYPAEAGGVPNQDYCALITRDPDTQLITNILNRDTNVGGDKGAGIDVAVRYALPTEYGRFGFAVDGTWLQRFNRTLADGTLIRARNTFDLGSGDVGGVYPDFKFNAGVRWGWKGYGAGVTTRYIDSYKECGDSFGDFFGGGLCYADSTFSRKVDSYNTWDLFLSYALRSRLGRTDVGVGMNNVFDEEPPFVYNGFIAQTDPTAYDFVGRFVYLRVAQTL